MKITVLDTVQRGNAQHLTEQELLQAIKESLPDAEGSQVDRFSKQYLRLQRLKNFFADHEKDLAGFEVLLAKAARTLNYERPYRIAIVGRTGVGKSQLINALLGRDLLVTKEGRPVTGTALEIFQDATADDERAFVTYRNAENIRSLVRREFVDRFQLTDVNLPNTLSTAYTNALQETEPPPNADSDRFATIQEALIGVVNQYLASRDTELPTEFSLADPEAQRELNALITEHSAQNQDDNTRKIGLIQSVAYHICPAKQIENIPDLQLPNNVCLVDLPGISGGMLHDIIITEGIQDADAVVFVVNPKRMGLTDEISLIERITEAIGLGGELDSAEQIFLVLNAIDESAVDKNSLDAAPMEALVGELYPHTEKPPEREDGVPYFKLSALAAYGALRQIQGDGIDNPRKYASIAQTLVPEIKVEYPAEKNAENAHVKTDHNAVLEASGIPNLVRALNQFARTHRVEKQIENGNQAISKIVSRLIRRYEIDLASKETKLHADFESRDEEKLAQRRQKVEDLLLSFRNDQLTNKGGLIEELGEQASEICDGIDEEILKQMPHLWVENLAKNSDITRAKPQYTLQAHHLISQVEVIVWTELTFRLRYLATSIAEQYTAELATTGLQKQLIELSYDHQLAKEAFSEDALAEVIEEMQVGLERFSERVALAFMPNSKFRFSSETPAQVPTDVNEVLGDTQEAIPNASEDTGLALTEGTVNGLSGTAAEKLTLGC